MKRQVKYLILLVIGAWMFSSASAGPIEALLPGHWYEIPNSRQDDAKPKAGEFPGQDWNYISSTIHLSFFQCGMDCWCGAAYDTKRDRLIFSGGGHGSYWGNEVYVFDLFGTQKWARLNDPILALDGQGFPLERDKYPSATHTYDGVDYLPPPIDRYVYMDWDYYFYTFDIEKRAWARKTDPTACNSSGAGQTMAVDVVTGTLFWHGAFTNHLSAYNPSTNTWKNYGCDSYLDQSPTYTMALDPVKRKIIAVGGNTFGGRKTIVWDISNLNATSIPGTMPGFTGATEIEQITSPGLEYDPVSGKFVAWGNGSGVYTLDIDTRVWTKVAAASSNTVTPTAPNVRNTYGKFRYVPSKNVFILANRSSDNVFIYKLTPDASAPQWYLDLLKIPGTGLEAAASRVNPNSLHIEPNPASGMTAICLDRDPGPGVTLSVFDISGRKAADLTMRRNGTGLLAGWNPAGNPAGIYTVQLNGRGWYFTKRVIVVR